MAHSFLCSLVLLYLLFAPSSYSAATVKKVDDICSKHRNPSFCAAVLNSKPGADLQSLALHTLELAKANATNALNQIQSLIKHTKDPDLKQHYKSCSENYDDALGGLDQAKEALSSGDYMGMNVAAAAVMTNLDDCDSQPQTDPSLPKNNKDLQDISVIIMIIANFLGNKA